VSTEPGVLEEKTVETELDRYTPRTGCGYTSRFPSDVAVDLRVDRTGCGYTSGSLRM